MREHTDADGRERRFRRAERGVSFTVSYALTIAIATILVSGVIATAGFIVAEQRESAIQDELQVVADDIAATVMAADRLAVAGNSSNLTVTRSYPEESVDQPYTVRIEGIGPGAVVTVSTQSPEVVARAPLRNRTAIANASVTGGTVRVVYRSATDELTIEEGRR